MNVYVEDAALKWIQLPPFSRTEGYHLSSHTACIQSRGMRMERLMIVHMARRFKISCE